MKKWLILLSLFMFIAIFTSACSTKQPSAKTMEDAAAQERDDFGGVRGANEGNKNGREEAWKRAKEILKKM